MRPLKVLVVEDEAVIAGDIRSSLIRHGYAVPETIGTGHEAIAKAETEKPDLALMDVQLKGEITGIEAAEQIIARFKIPVVFLTAHEDEQTLKRVTQIGADGFLIKPFRDQELCTTIKMVIEKSRREKRLSESEERFRLIFEQTSDAVFLVGQKNGRIVALNANAHEHLSETQSNFSKMQICNFNKALTEAVLKERIGEVLPTGKKVFEAKFWTKENEIRDVLITAKQISIQRESYILSTIQDCTEKKKAMAAERLSTSIFKGAHEGIMITSRDVKIFAVNPAFEKITGYSAKEVLGQNPRFLSADLNNPDFYKTMWKEINRSGHWEGEILNKKKDGRTYVEWLSITALKDEEGQVIRYVGLFTDISKRKADEERLHHQAYYDPLTGLPNRLFIFERLSQVIKETRRYKKKAALLFLDLDRFKQVNDTLGHLAGDALLKMAADRLISSIRESDTVARSGGDEFLILLPSIDRKGAKTITQKIINALSQPFHIEGHITFLGASVGISIIPDDGEAVSSLLKNADMAMYKAKASGRNKLTFFSEKKGQISESHALLEWDLQRAITRQEFVLYYQPIVDLRTHKIIALEALVRWNHPQKGLLLPKQFFSVAEAADLTHQMSRGILQAACKQAKRWQDRFRFDASIHINVSMRQIIYGNFCANLTEQLAESGLSASTLTLEVTERLMLDSVEDPISKLQEIKDTGVSIALDDFGIGYSSLSYLARYPIDILKIDQSLIHHVATDKRKQSLVEAIICMGQSMKLTVVAEGVETEADDAYLAASGCDAAQGYYFGKPAPAKTLEALLENRLENDAE